MPSTEKLDTHRKALTLNLDTSKFGSFAESGAGQEVARWFLAVGGASGKVAKTISAYDQEVSDTLYGTGSGYVFRQRLEAILETEWTQLAWAIGRDPRIKHALLLFCRYSLCAKLRRNKRFAWLGWTSVLVPSARNT